MARHNAIVIENIDGRATVKMARHNACDNCGSCPGDSALITEVDANGFDLSPGQSVVVDMPEKDMLRAAFVVYIMPLLAAFAGTLAGLWLGPVVGAGSTSGAVTGGVVVFFAAVYAVVKYERHVRKTATPRVVRTI